MKNAGKLSKNITATEFDNGYWYIHDSLLSSKNKTDIGKMENFWEAIGAQQGMSNITG